MTQSAPSTQKHQRVGVQLDVRISTVDAERDASTGKPFFRSSTEYCLNVSRGGAFVATDEPVPSGRRLLIEMTIPDGPSLQAIGRVVWTQVPSAGASTGRRPGMGIEFVGGPAEELQALENYIAGLSPGWRTASPKAVNPVGRGASNSAP